MFDSGGAGACDQEHGLQRANVAEGIKLSTWEVSDCETADKTKGG